MHKLFSYQYQKYVYELFIGDYIATQEKDVLLSTVLGPCIAVCLADELSGVIGMNHFMLPGRSEEGDSRYGLDSTERLIEDMLEKGAELHRLKAKVFGGATLFKIGNKSVADSNVSCITDYLSHRNIPVEATDIGRDCGRRVFYCSTTYSVYLKRFAKIDAPGQLNAATYK